MLKALNAGRDEVKRVDQSNPEYVDRVDERIRSRGNWFGF
uniref:Uncharacterized protein n=1 Tax=Marseillevirus LCMAC201 TaxID=2506605 RepID=A0A481YYQ7_9VIRU|nr:MAG: hypothetical protein LCMAC201_05090 [Marseillevirus LCMAC201]